MRLEACLVLLLNVLSSCMRRGPHHPHGQMPIDHHHHHYKPRGQESLTGDSQLLHDMKHIEEDSKVLTSESLAKMTPEELEFHYFSAHDFDRNSKLDGLELLKNRPRWNMSTLPLPRATRVHHVWLDNMTNAGSAGSVVHFIFAVYHTLEHEAPDPDADSSIEPEANDFDSYIALVDRTLESDDSDSDGFVSYAEYRAARLANASNRTPRVIAANALS